VGRLRLIKDGSGTGAEFAAHQDETRRLVRAMMRLTGLSASALARAAGLTASTLNRFMHREVRHTLSQRTMVALMIVTFDHLKSRQVTAFDRGALDVLAPAIAVFERALVGHDAENASIIAAVRGKAPRDNQAAGTGDIAVLTAGATGIDPASGNFSAALLRTLRPPFLSGDARAFAVLMPDASMSPRFEAGDLLYVSPLRAIDEAGADLIAFDRGGRFVIGRRALSGDAIVPFSDARNRGIPAADAAAIFRIVGSHRP
jgi:putative intracellular protease/amidase